MHADVTVLVVGAGPTGLLLASELNRRRVSCRVIDSHPAPLHWDRATVVHPRSLEVFESLGLVDQLLAAGVKQRMIRLHSGGSLLGEIDLSICGSRYGFNVGLSEEVTEAILTEYLYQQGGEVIRSSRLVELEDREDGVIATIDRNGAIEQISAKWLVGCDGFHSTTRRLSGIELAGDDIAEPWAVFDATLAGWSDSYEANYAYMDEIPVILTALPAKRWRVYLRPSSPQSDLLVDAASTISRYLRKVRFDDVVNLTRFQCHSKVAKRFRSGHVLLAGDAAHVCTPAQGHGMNSGLQDSLNLAWKLALVCQGHCNPVLLDSYESERRPVANTIAISGDAIEKSLTTATTAERSVRDKELREALLAPTPRHQEAVAEAELDIDYGGSPIVLGDESGTLGPGQRLPDTIEVSLASGECCWLHELAHRAGHTVFLIGGSSARRDELVHLDSCLRARDDASFVDTAVVLTARPEGQDVYASLAATATEQLGIATVTLLVIRPDGHVGLRADHHHVAAMAAYRAMLVFGQSGETISDE
jgi:2-polyprenyl-6-methoxyphenol hydroxylase-like FAD-dependent oxidoreductase